MRQFIPTVILISIGLATYAQGSDFISVKKRNNRTLKTFFPGSVIECETVYGNYVAGTIISVRNDSIFIKESDVRAVPNPWGVFSVDTIGTYIAGIHYKEIDRVILRKRESFYYIRNGTILMIGGLGYAALNLLNGKYLKESITGSKNRKSLGIALGVAGAGFLIYRLKKYNDRNGRRYRVEYIHMGNLPKAF